MYGLIAEDNSDAETLEIIIRRLSYNSSLPVRSFGYGGCGAMLRKGAAQLRLFAEAGCTRLIVCYDADGPNSVARAAELVRRVIGPSGLKVSDCLALIPVQEIEAWFLADLDAAAPHIFSGWRPSPVAKPESIASPKEDLVQRSNASNKKPRYSPPTHNPQMARYLDLIRVGRKCPSFRSLQAFVDGQALIRPPADIPAPTPERTIRAYAGTGGENALAGEVGTAQEWGELAAYIDGLSALTPELARLRGFGCARSEELNAELLAVLKKKPKAIVRRVILRVQQALAIHPGAEHLGLSDGWGPLCPECGSHEPQPRGRKSQ